MPSTVQEIMTRHLETVLASNTVGAVADSLLFLASPSAR